ncbi:MAG: hypothetical protein ABIQ31_17785 [Ferruginibacter sp.]
MPKLSTQNILGTISIFADIASIIAIISTFKGYTMSNFFCNPYVPVLFYALICTILVYLLPYLTRMIPNIIWKITAFVSIGIALIILIYFFIRISGSRNCNFSTDVFTKSDTIKVVHDTIRLPTPISKEYLEPIKNPSYEIKQKKTETPAAIHQENKNADNNSAGRDNNGVQGGRENINHIVNGTNYGVNGDVNINAEKKLTDVEKKDILQLIIRVKKDNDIYNTTIMMLKAQNNNAPTFTKELREFLINSGYNLSKFIGGTSPAEIEGVTISTMPHGNDRYVVITVGHF